MVFTDPAETMKMESKCGQKLAYISAARRLRSEEDWSVTSASTLFHRASSPRLRHGPQRHGLLTESGPGPSSSSSSRGSDASLTSGELQVTGHVTVQLTASWCVYYTDRYSTHTLTCPLQLSEDQFVTEVACVEMTFVFLPGALYSDWCNCRLFALYSLQNV